MQRFLLTPCCVWGWAAATDLPDARTALLTDACTGCHQVTGEGGNGISSIRQIRSPDELVDVLHCYSHVGTDCGISIVGVYRATDARLAEVLGSDDISPRGRLSGQRRLEASYTDGRYSSITKEMFAIS